MNYSKAFFEMACGTSKQLPPSEAPEIVFSGRSNVGKSSLLNKLFNRKSLAKVSSNPGKTITINFYDVDSVKFVDLPGYGYAKVNFKEKERFGELMEYYFQSGRNIKLVVQLVDMRHKPSKDDYQMFSFLQAFEIPFIIALTKSDKLKKTQYLARLEELKEEISFEKPVEMIPFSAVTGQGVDELKKQIEMAIS